MISATSNAISGMSAAMAALGASAQRVARAPTSVANSGNELAPEPEVDLAREMVAQRQAVYDFKANFRAVQTVDQMMGTLLDTFA